MKQIILIILILTISSISKGNVNIQNTPSTKNTNDYSLEIYPDAKTNVCIVKFNIPQSAFVKIIMIDDTDNTTETLTEGEMEIGEYCIYFKSDVKSVVDNYTCRMEVSQKENGTVVFSKEISLKEK